MDWKFFPKDVVSGSCPTKKGDEFEAVVLGSPHKFIVTEMHLGWWFAELKKASNDEPV